MNDKLNTIWNNLNILVKKNCYIETYFNPLKTLGRRRTMLCCNEPGKIPKKDSHVLKILRKINSCFFFSGDTLQSQFLLYEEKFNLVRLFLQQNKTRQIIMFNVISQDDLLNDFFSQK